MAETAEAGGVGLFVWLFAACGLEIDSGWRSRNVCSPFWRLYRHDRPGARLRLAEGGEHELTPDRLHLVPAWVTFSCQNRGVVHQLYAHFDVVGLPGVLGREVFDAPITLPSSPRLEAEAAELAEGLFGSVGHPVGSLRVKALVHGALAGACAGLDPERSERLAALVAGGEALAPAMRYVENNLGERLDNALLGELCHMSPDHFIRRFRAHTGATPRQFIVERRIAAAARALVLGDESMEAIASRCGFANRHYFTRVFRRHMGIPPAAYREMARRGAGR